MNNTEIVNDIAATTEEKQAWITPAATIEQVSEATLNNPGIGGDSFGCTS